MSNVSNEYNEALLEPLKYYREELKDAFQQVTEEYFQDLVNQSKVDIDTNRIHHINDLDLLRRLILLLG